MKTTTRILVAIVALGLPGPMIAGGYGDTAVKDARVGQTASAGDTVYCQRLDQSVPVRLAEQMDCNGPAARPRVAAERTSSGLLGALTNLFSGDGTGGPREDGKAGDNSDDERASGGGGGTPTGGGDDTGGGGSPDGSDDGSGGGDDSTSDFQSKWDRLSELGVERGTLSDQDDAFKDAFQDYRQEHGSSGNWKDFDPPSN